jgi:hypothetical protein
VRERTRGWKGDWFLRWTLSFVFALGLTGGAALASEDGYGDLDFTKLNQYQTDFLWKRIGVLAFEEALISHCDHPDDFAVRAKQAIKACVTADAMRTAESYYRVWLKKNTDHIKSYGAKWACKGPVTINGHYFEDEAVVVTGAKRDLDYVVAEIADMCSKCKTSIWAAFCH